MPSGARSNGAHPAPSSPAPGSVKGTSVLLFFFFWGGGGYKGLICFSQYLLLRMTWFGCQVPHNPIQVDIPAKALEFHSVAQMVQRQKAISRRRFGPLTRAISLRFGPLTGATHGNGVIRMTVQTHCFRFQAATVSRSGQTDLFVVIWGSRQGRAL